MSELPLCVDPACPWKIKHFAIHHEVGGLLGTVIEEKERVDTLKRKAFAHSIDKAIDRALSRDSH